MTTGTAAKFFAAEEKQETDLSIIVAKHDTYSCHFKP